MTGSHHLPPQRTIGHKWSVKEWILNDPPADVLQQQQQQQKGLSTAGTLQGAKLNNFVQRQPGPPETRVYLKTNKSWRREEALEECRKPDGYVRWFGNWWGWSERNWKKPMEEVNKFTTEKKVFLCMCDETTVMINSEISPLGVIDFDWPWVKSNWKRF